MAVSEEDKQTMYRNILHAAQVQDGLVPVHSPPGFTVPPSTDHAVEVSYDDMPPFHDDDIAAIRARLGLLDEDE